MSVVSPEWPMTTRVRSTPSSAKIVCCSSPRRGAGVGVRGDRHPGLPVRLGDRAQHPLDARGDAGFVGGALEDCRLDAGVGDTVLDVADEHVGHGLRAAELVRRGPGSGRNRHVVVGVQPGGDDDVQLGGRRDAGDARNVAAQPDHGQVDDGVDAAGLQFVEPIDGVGFPFGFVAPGFRVVLTISVVMMNTCSCISVTPISVVLTGPEAVFTNDT